jgi:phage FluMu gp28-like protein
VSADLPLLLRYQQRWIDDRAPVKICVKSRRIGITWASGYEAVEGAALDAREGGHDVWYMSYAEEAAKEFPRDVEDWARATGLVCAPESWEEDAAGYYMLDGGKAAVRVSSLRFKSGHRVSVLPALPRSLRGKDGHFILDEANDCPDLPGAIEASMAFQMWGGRVSIVGTVGDVDGDFNKLVEMVRAGAPETEGWSLHVITLLDAIADGFYRRVCEKIRKPWTLEGEREYVRRRLAEFGAGSEYMCIPRRSGGQYLPRSIVEPCCDRVAPVVRFIAPEDFMALPEEERDEQIDEWCAAELGPLLEVLPQDKPHFLGEDFGRASDLTFIAPGYLDQRLNLRVPFMVMLGNVPYESQKRVLFYIAKRLPRLTHMVLDKTGNGAYLAEQAVLYWGESVAEGVDMGIKWYAENMPKVRARFQDQTISIPSDLHVLEDLGMFQVIDGVPRMPKQRIAAAKEDRRRAGKNLLRHGDAGIAIACLVAASTMPSAPLKYTPVPASRGLFAMKGII